MDEITNQPKPCTPCVSLSSTAIFPEDVIFQTFDEPVLSYGSLWLTVGHKAKIGNSCIIGFGTVIRDYVCLDEYVVIHNGVMIGYKCNVGMGTEIGYLSRVMCSVIGELVSIGPRVSITDYKTSIGGRTVIGNNSEVSYAKIGSDVVVGNHVKFQRPNYLNKPIIVGDNSKIGDNVEIRSGVHIPNDFLVPNNYIVNCGNNGKPLLVRK